MITGTPTAITSTTSYTITATNSGSGTATISITVNDAVPNLTYVGAPFTFTKSTAITTQTPTNSGGTPVTCTSTPALPAGLAIANTTCAITGTPTAVAATASYSISATNTGGSASISISITVNDVAPAITYTGSPFTYTKGTAITALNATNTGGTITGCTSTPTLPAGLAISNTTCAITGTPTAVVAAANYTVTATNSGGSSSATINITVNDTLPSLTYAGAPYTFTNGSAITAKTPTNTGGTPTSCSSSPGLPAGLTISATCVITGTPSAVAATASYTITATNSAGSASVTIGITVNDVVPSIAYTGSPFTYTNGTAITTLTATNTGGAITGCTSSPSLPAGLTISATTCAISGTPTAVVSATAYTITATNSGGSSAGATINITVKDVVPAIAYTGAPFTFTKGVAITAQTPTNSGGTIISCSPSVALPTGLSLSSACVITGTPTAITGTASYTITATNSGGSGAVTISITVNDAVPVIAYSGAPYTFTKNVAITTQTPTNTGGAITGCSSSPTLPTGLSISNTTCAISGTPSAITAAASYTITATNTGGNGTATITIAVNDAAPAINYLPTSYNFTYTKGTAITANTPNNTGGAITSCSSTPALPAGLSLSNANCSMTGTPTVVSAAASYTITATNTGGTSTAVITITINDAVPVISYAGSPYAFTKNVAITAQTPTNTGGAIASCSSSPTLPAGLSLSSACVISGTPTAITASASYTITATNTGGSGTATITIAVNDVAPTISYAGSPFTYTIGVAITTLTPTLGGGAVTSCSSSPALPAGLSISNTTCAISGTPTAVSGATAYTITASNSGGSPTATINITVQNGPPILSYAGSPFTYVKGTAITTLNPTNTGGAITSCSSSPSLPAGLTLSTACVLSGTPTAVVAAANYTITATNSKGSNNATINITVNDPAPQFNYSPSTVAFVLRTAAPTTTPVSTGGTITGCSSSPTLPTGLSISSTCVITGTPTAITAAANYTITATNTGGSSTATINVQVKDQPRIAYHSLTATSGSFNGTATGSNNIWTATQDGVDHTKLTTNTNAGLDSINPSWNAAGTGIVSSSKRSTNGANNGTATGSYNIWTMSPTGTSPLSQTTNTSTVRDSDDPPVFSPDGTKLAFASLAAVNGTNNGTASGAYNIFIVNSDGTGRTALTQNTIAGYDSYAPVFSPDGTLIYFYSHMSSSTANGGTYASYNIWRMNIDGSNKLMLTAETTATVRDCTNPQVSADGSSVVYVSKSRIGTTTANSFNIWKMNYDGTSRTNLTSNTTAGLDSQQASFSPDGTEIVFASLMKISGSTANSYNIWKMSSSGLSQSPLTTNTAASLDSENPQYSPDNTKIAFSSLMNVGASASSSYNVFVINSDGTGSPVAVTSNTNAGLDSHLGTIGAWFAP